MKLPLLFALAGFLVAELPVVRAATPEPLPTTFFKNLAAGKPQTVVVYGTSLTHGGAWAVALKEWLDAEFPGKVKFVNSGGPGQNSDWGVTNLKAKVLDLTPGLVLIEFAFNDAHEKFKLPVEKGAANLDRMVKEIQAKDKGTDVVLQIMNVPWDAPNGKGSATARPKLQDFNENYRKYAAEKHLPLVDHYPNWLKLQKENPDRFQKWVPDGTHPSAEGSRAVTWPAIKSLLERARAAAK